MVLTAETSTETWSIGNIKQFSYWNWSKNGPWNKATVMEATQWLAWSSSPVLSTELSVRPRPERIPIMDGDRRCVVSNWSDCNSPLGIFLSPIHFHLKPLGMESGPTLLPKSITSTPSPIYSYRTLTSGLSASWQETTVIINIKEPWSQGSWRHPSVCHFAQPVVCWEPVGQFAVLWQPRLCPDHSNKRPDHIPWQAPQLIRVITHSRGCPPAAQVCEMDCSHPWLLEVPTPWLLPPHPMQARNDDGKSIAVAQCIYNMPERLLDLRSQDGGSGPPSASDLPRDGRCITENLRGQFLLCKMRPRVPDMPPLVGVKTTCET